MDLLLLTSQYVYSIQVWARAPTGDCMKAFLYQVAFYTIIQFSLSLIPVAHVLALEFCHSLEDYHVFCEGQTLDDDFLIPDTLTARAASA